MKRGETNPWVYTHTGRRFHFLRPQPNELCIEDVAWSLARQSRFYGHTHGDPYSTAQHCVLASLHCEPGYEWPALMHDGAESILGDVSKRVKWLLPDYMRIERRVERWMMRQFKVPYPFAPEVHDIDQIMAATEMRDLQRRDDWRERPYPPLKERIKPWPWREAHRAFLKRYRELAP